jgi:hypothetical protein
MRTVWVMSLLCSSGCFSQLTGNASITCESLENCPAGYVCDPVAKACREVGELPGCARDTDCPLAQICLAGVCGVGCVRDGDCGPNAACIDGACVGDGRCNDSATCPFGQACTMGRCQVPSGGASACRSCFEPIICLTDAECPGTICERPDLGRYGRCQSCGGGICRYESTSDPGCSEDSQCGEGRYCYRSPCANDDYCSQNQWGSCGTFRSRDGKPAADGVAGTCTRGTCVQSSCTFACDSQSDRETCGRGYQCTRFISIPATRRCTTDGQCGADSRCRRVNESDTDQFCSCTRDADCPMNTKCQEGACVVSEECTPVLGLTCEDLLP